jgi:hypothetical protein
MHCTEGRAFAWLARVCGSRQRTASAVSETKVLIVVLVNLRSRGVDDGFLGRYGPAGREFEAPEPRKGGNQGAHPVAGTADVTGR